MDDALLWFLDQLARFGAENDARETARSRRMLNITLDTGWLLRILVVATGARRIDARRDSSNGAAMSPPSFAYPHT